MTFIAKPKVAHPDLPRNALGLVKFIFPNTESVYLHATPRSERFEQVQRDLSHGCISVEDPAGLAAWVLRGQPGWSRETIRAAMSGSSTRRLSTPAPPSVTS